MNFKKPFALLAALLLSATVHAQAVSGQGTWETTLQGRDISGNAVAATSASAVFLYDTDLNVTWLRNANANGAMNWYAANSWASNLVVGGIDNWALPTMSAPITALSCSNNGTNCGYNVYPTSSQMAHLFFTTLGDNSIVNTSGINTSGVVQGGYGLTNVASFQNLQSSLYWSGTALAGAPGTEWYFSFNGGYQNGSSKTNSMYALAVRPGDVLTPVPEPETFAMLLVGLGLLAVVRHRQQVSSSAL